LLDATVYMVGALPIETSQPIIGTLTNAILLKITIEGSEASWFFKREKVSMKP
jgi:hypothetical protein